MNGNAVFGAKLSAFESAAVLLSEADPGPTPMLVEGLVGLGAILAIQGGHKVGKTWLLLELALAIVTGRPALGRFAVATPGPVLLVLEESGRAALHRRLDALTRGAGLSAADLADLHFAANRRVRLNDPEWRQALTAKASEVKPQAVFFDPLVRVKGASLDEDSQKDMSVVLDFMRDLRDATGAAVGFTHHTGHQGGRLRGTSDLEAYWESKISVMRHPNGICELASEHREAEAPSPVRYRFVWDASTRAARLEPLDLPARPAALLELIVAHLTEHPGSSRQEVVEAVPRRASDVRKALDDGTVAGTVYRAPSERRDPTGRGKTICGYFANSDGDGRAVPDDRTASDGQHGRATDRPPVRGSTRPRRDGLLDERDGNGAERPIAAAREILEHELLVAPCAYEAHRSTDWRSTSGQVVCGVCHPPATPELVATTAGDHA